VNQRVKIHQRLPINVPNHLLYLSHVQHQVQRARGPRSTLHTTYITFSMCLTTYKKQWAPDRRSIQLLLLSARASLHTKSKGLHRYVLHIYYLINHVFKSFCSLADIIIDGLAWPLTPRARLLVFIRMWESKWARDHHLSWSGMSAPIGS
jgi:hypothetical protein